MRPARHPLHRPETHRRALSFSAGFQQTKSTPCFGRAQSVKKNTESSRGPKPSRTFNRARRRVRREGCLPEGQASRFATGKAKSKISVCRRRGDFCGGKSHFPEQKSLPCSFCARKSERFQQKLVGVCLHSYNDTENANTGVIIERHFQRSGGEFWIYSLKRL